MQVVVVTQALFVLYVLSRSTFYRDSLYVKGFSIWQLYSNAKSMKFILRKHHKSYSIWKGNTPSILILFFWATLKFIFSIWSSYLCSKSIFSLRDFPLRKINMEQLLPLEIRFFILQFWKNLKINMEQLFALQMDAFLSGAPQGCELQEHLIKHKVLGSLFGTQNGTMWSRGGEKDLPRPYVYKVCAKFATLRIH